MIGKAYSVLLNAYGSQGWWPLSGAGMPVKHSDKDYANYLKFRPDGTASDFSRNWPRHLGITPKTEKQKLEICVGAILTQNTSWSNVEKALYKLNKAGLMQGRRLLNIEEKELAPLIRSSGYYNQKAKKLKLFLAAAMQHKGIVKMLRLRNLREELLEIKGIGNETADSIALYAAGKPYFVIDAYTRRIMSRVLGKDFKTYEEWQQLFTQSLPEDVELFKEYHALLVEHAKRHCRAKPACSGCALQKQCRH